MKIKVEGVKDTLLKRSRHYEQLKTKIPEMYRRAVADTLASIQVEAARNLNKPHWLLSSYLTRKIVLYNGGAFIFGMAGVAGGRNDGPNQPGQYGRYHEYGYFLSLDKAKNKRPNRIRKRKVRGKQIAYSYEQTKGKHFLRKAYRKYKKTFEQQIRDTNIKIQQMIFSEK